MDDDHDPSRPQKPDWSVWGLFEEAPEQDAVVLSCNVAPEWFRQGIQEGPLLNEIVRRLTVIRNRIETVSMPGFAHRLMSDKKVRTFLGLRTFRGWAEKNLHWAFPEEFPRPVEPAEAGAPEAPMVPSDAGLFIPPKPKWERWRHLHKVQLWEAIILSLEFDPASFYPHKGAIQGIPIRKGTEFWATPLNAIPLMRPEDRERINYLFDVSANHLGDSLPMLEESKFHPTQSMIRLHDYAAWSVRMGFSVPDGFPRSVPMASASTAGEAAMVGPWPWGTYETDELRIMAKAAQHFFSEPRKRPPAKKEVAAWLDENGLKVKRTAAMIAQILCGK